VFLGRVIGCVWATAKNPQMEGIRFLLVQPLTPELQNTAKRLICADASGAGAGELVYWVRGREATLPFRPKEVPSDATIVGIVDEVNVNRPPDASAKKRGSKT
jgi:microcompartment protein CcmK/EutM